MCADRTDPEIQERPVALVTGAGRRAGIATATALHLAQAGWDVALTHFAPYDARMTWGADAGPPRNWLPGCRRRERACSTEADFQDVETPARVFDQVHTALGPVTGLVLGHCESVDSTILDTDLESFDRHFAVNTRAGWLLIREYARRFSSAPCGSSWKS